MSRPSVAGVEVAAEEPDLELVEGIEREPAALDGVAPPLGRILDTLQRNKRVDAADGAQAVGAGAARRCVRLAEAESLPRPAAAPGVVATAAVPFDP